MRAIACAVATLALAASVTAMGFDSDAEAGVCTVVTASSVVKTGGAGVVPPATNCAGLPCASYLAPVSCLGLEGPISALGPLGWLGPVGSNGWNPSAWMGAFGDWTHYSSQISGKTSAPLSSAGPLGAYNTLATNTNDFMKQLQAGGLFTVLGPLGPLGALGALGPLGPLGIHGLARDTKRGFFHTSAAPMVPVRTVTYPWDATTKKTWELYEYFPSIQAARALPNQDTSFMYESNIYVDLMLQSKPDVISFTSASAQYVTIVVVPQRMSDNFVLTVSDAKSGRALASSGETFYINWVQVRAVAGQKLTATVKFGATSVPSPTGFNYRLFVTGSTGMFPNPGVTGAQCK